MSSGLLACIGGWEGHSGWVEGIAAGEEPAQGRGGALPSLQYPPQSAGQGLANPSLSREVLGLPTHAASLFLGLTGWWARGDVICAPQISAVRRAALIKAQR